MTIAMPDSVNVNNLNNGYNAYMGYADGEYPTAAQLAGLFPEANRVILTVTGATIACDGADIEPGNLNAAEGAAWAAGKLRADPGSRPVLYASVEGDPGYGMDDVRDHLAALGVPVAEVRLLSAHYGAGAHICGPHSCDLIDIQMDGTQWTDAFATPAGKIIDMSMLQDNFFGPISETGVIVRELGIVRQGMTGAAVKTVQGLCNARGATLTIDGVFGNQTLSAVKFTQSLGKVTVDGIVGLQTWPVLLDIA